MTSQSCQCNGAVIPARPRWSVLPVMHVCALGLACVAGGLAEMAAQAPIAQPTATSIPRVTLVSAPTILLPGLVDSNSPAVWDLEDGERRLFVMTSASGAPHVSSGRSVSTLAAARDVAFTSHPGHGLWLEAVVVDEGGTWYGYYHNEVPAVTCGRPDRSVARIGAARSTDRGRTWENLGIILEADADAVACASPNQYVIGGVGDLSVMLDATKTDLYLFVSQYEKAQASQGVAVARLLWAARDRPVGRVEVWAEGAWQRSRLSRTPAVGVDGMLRRFWFDYPTGTPLVAPLEAWHDSDGKVDAFWGPSVHWNDYLGQYVMLLNRAKDEKYVEEGVYVSYAPRLDDPRVWSVPQKLLNGGQWYPQVIGLTPESGTDKSAGAVARFFMGGRSDWLISFTR